MGSVLSTLPHTESPASHIHLVTEVPWHIEAVSVLCGASYMSSSCHLIFIIILESA